MPSGYILIGCFKLWALTESIAWKWELTTREHPPLIELSIHVFEKLLSQMIKHGPSEFQSLKIRHKMTKLSNFITRLSG